MNDSNENSSQPLDQLMTKLGLSNKDLVFASTEQLSFKMVQKGRRGRTLSRNVQEKILRALLTVKPELQIRRDELFPLEGAESAQPQIVEVPLPKPVVKAAAPKRKKVPGIVRTTRKARVAARKRFFKRKRR